METFNIGIKLVLATHVSCRYVMRLKCKQIIKPLEKCFLILKQ